MSRLREDIKLKGFKITVSTKYDVSEETVKRFVKWACKHVMAYVVLETGESTVKHLHALVCFETGYVKRNLQDYIWKNMVKMNDEGCIQKYAVRVDVLYDRTWYDEYLRKEDTVEIVLDTYDIDRESDFYPDQETQDLLQSTRDINAAADPYYAAHEAYFNEWFYNGEPPRPCRVAKYQDGIEYLYYRMNVVRDMRVISDTRRIRQLGVALIKYVLKSSEASFEDRKHCASEIGPTMDFAQ